MTIVRNYWPAGIIDRADILRSFCNRGIPSGGGTFMLRKTFLVGVILAVALLPAGCVRQATGNQPADCDILARAPISE
jgi:hypothetical protein